VDETPVKQPGHGAVCDPLAHGPARPQRIDPALWRFFCLPPKHSNIES